MKHSTSVSTIILLFITFTETLGQQNIYQDKRTKFQTTWDIFLVIVSYFIALVGSFTTLQLIHQLKFSVSKMSRLFWIFLASFVLGGVAIWSMHFIGMASVKVLYATKILKMSYDFKLTLFSLFIGIFSCFVGLFIADVHHFSSTIRNFLLPFRDENYQKNDENSENENNIQQKIKNWILKLLDSHNDPDKPHIFQILLGGTLTATGVVTMHYSGMEALVIQAKFKYSPFLFILSLVIALIAAVAALTIVFASKTILEHFIAAVVMGVAVSGMHYTGMASVVYYEYIDSVAVIGLRMEHLILAVIVMSLVTCMLMVFVVSIQNSSRNERLDRLVESKTYQLTEERNRSEELLLNILPPRIAIKMKQGQTDIYEEYLNATILFSDIVGFTKMSNTMTSKQLVVILNDLVSKFDDLVISHQIEKIKTIGDAYMVVGGIPEDPFGFQANQVMKFAIEMINTVGLFNKSTNLKYDIKIRVGMNTGRVVGGVIGTVKFSFDVWGEAVNYASRMESSGIENQIQVSASTAKLIRNKFQLKLRENVEIKSLGKVNTYLYNPEDFLKKNV
eukprot:gene3322-5761_t